MDEYESQYESEKLAEHPGPVYDEGRKKRFPIVIAAVLGTIFGMVITLVLGNVYLRGLTKEREAQSEGVMGKLSADELIEGPSSNKLETIITYINQFYYKDVTDEQLTEGVYAGLLDSLDDPYSEYFTTEEYEEYRQALSANYAGIGALLQKDKGTGAVQITKVYPDTPAEKAGLKEGDTIISADKFIAVDEELDEFVQHIRGEEGTKVELVISRGDKEITVTCTRASISAPTVEHKMLDDKVGYIAVSQFAETTYNDFVAAYEDLESQGMTSVIFDMRDNGGGLLDSVVDMLDYLLPKGVVVYTQDKYEKQEDFTSDDKHQKNIPMIVLVNGNTASAAEIFTGALRDFDYATIIGTKTFGKGIVQSTIPFSDGSAIKLTTQTYYTPSGECIQGKGINPDIELKFEFLGEEDEKYSTDKDNQIQRALEELKK